MTKRFYLKATGHLKLLQYVKQELNHGSILPRGQLLTLRALQVPQQRHRCLTTVVDCNLSQ